MTTLGVLDRITSTTTLADIGVLCGRYGVHKFDIKISPEDTVTTIIVLYSERCISVGKGQTLPEAFDDAFARIMHLTGADLLQGPKPEPA